jgi:GT2 family glycosyltransferase
MTAPSVSVILPVYNQAEYLAEAVESVLDQSYRDFELIIVNDGSTDDAERVMQQFTDPRIRYIFQDNRGLPGARNTGIRASAGQLLAFLDADDRFHPDKLRAQTEFVRKHSSVGLVYTARFEVDRTGAYLALVRTPEQVTLSDLVLGFPLTPTDVLVRRGWANRVGLFDETFVLNSEDRDFHLRLMLDGCQFAGLDRYLSYRRLHAGRTFRDNAAKLATMLRALETAFTDPRCPSEVVELRRSAQAQVYLAWACQEALQADTQLMAAHVEEAVALDNSLRADAGSRLLRFLIFACMRAGDDHEAPVHRLFGVLPAAVPGLRNRRDEAVGRGYLLRAVRAAMWGRDEEAHACLCRAADFRVRPDELDLRNWTDELLCYAATFGVALAEVVLQRWTQSLEALGAAAEARWLRGCYTVNRAFASYRAGNYIEALSESRRAVCSHPAYLAERGVLSMVGRSLVATLGLAPAVESST